MQKKYILFFLLVNLFQLTSFGQCPNGTIELLTQEDIDNFIIDYPNCTSLNYNYLKIGNDSTISDSITNLAGLSNLTYIYRISIVKTPNLTSLQDLENLTGVNSFHLRHTSVTSLNGLQNLTEIEGQLQLHNNDFITNIDELSSVTTSLGSIYLTENELLENIDGISNISNVVKSVVSIRDNPILSNLNGLQNLTHIKSKLEIDNNDSLINLEGLNNLEIIGNPPTTYITFHDLIIENNDNLTNIYALSNLKHVDNHVEIRGNSSLTSLEGLEGLTVVNGDLIIQSNEILENISGIQNITSIKKHFNVIDNPILSTLDSFANLTEVGGSINISKNHALVNLVGLNQLDIANGFLTVYKNNALQTLEGLENITFVKSDFRIIGNDNLETIEHLSSLTEIEDSIEIEANNSLENLIGLDNLSIIGKNLRIKNNIALNSIASLENITKLGNVYFYNNDALPNFHGLHNLETITENLFIVQNYLIQDLTGFESLTSITHELQLSATNAVSLNGINNLTSVGRIYIYLSANLSDISALSSLTTVETRLTLWNLNGLTNLNGLENIQSLDFDISLTDNDDLEDCTGICHIINNENFIGSVTLSENLENCNSELAIKNDCEGNNCEISSILPENITVCPNTILNDLELTLAENETIQWFLNESTTTSLDQNHVLENQNYFVEITNSLEDCTSDRIEIQLILEDITNPETPTLETIYLECGEDFSILNPTTTDSCFGEITGITTDNINFSEIGNYTITWSFTDESGNSSQAIQQIILQDTMEPEIPVLETIYLECGEDYSILSPTTIDLCSGEIIGTTTDNPNFSEVGNYTITWNFTDENGNNSQAIQQIILQDTMKPEVPGLEIIYLECGEDYSISSPTTIDSCSGEIIGTTTDNPNFSEVGNYTITWNFTDESGNSSQAIQQIILQDTTKPEIPVLETISVECNSIPEVTTTDNCDGIIIGTMENSQVLQSGTNHVTWIFEDSSGNISSANQTIILSDTEPPIPPEIPIIYAECEFTISEVPNATDLCSNLIITLPNTENLTFTTPGIHEVIWTFEDTSGNISSTTQTVIIQDTEAPIFSNPIENQLIDLEENCSYIIPDFTTYDFEAFDNCDSEIIISQNIEAGTEIFENTNITITFSDSSGNESSFSFDIELIDTIPPLLVCGSTKTVLAQSGFYSLENLTSTISILNACEDYTILQNPSPGTILPLGYHSISFTIIDSFGNENSCTKILHVSATLEVNEELFDSQISIYPNPATHFISIKSELNLDEIVIYNQTGKIVLKDKINDTKKIDISNFSKGIYFIKIFSDKKSTIKKLSIY